MSGENGRPQPRHTDDRGDEENGLETERNCDVLLDIQHRPLRQINHSGHVRDAAVKHRCVGGFQRDIGTATHRNADVRSSERRCIADTVANLGNR